MKAPPPVRAWWMCLALLAAGGPGAAVIEAQSAVSACFPVPLPPEAIARLAPRSSSTPEPGFEGQAPLAPPRQPLAPAGARPSILQVPVPPDRGPAIAPPDAPSLDTGLPGVAEVEAPRPVAPPPGRPLVLTPLYVSFAALQVADVASTGLALEAGGREANPIVRGFADQSAAMLAVKAGATVGTIYLAERLWKKNRPAAIVLMASLNGAYAAIVAHNYRGRWQH